MLTVMIKWEISTKILKESQMKKISWILSLLWHPKTIFCNPKYFNRQPITAKTFKEE